MMKLQSLYKGVKIIETLENYSLAASKKIARNKSSSIDNSTIFYDDYHFWRAVSSKPDNYWRKKITLYNFVVSSWVARVPGLYWTKSSEVMREHTPEEVAISSKDWLELRPPGKSKKVLGGIGSLQFPPNDDGKTIMSVSSSCNASTGIPILVFPEVLDFINIRQGDLVEIRDAIWMPLSMEWSKRFATTMEVPRGYLVISDIRQIVLHERNIPVVYHPFSIMEYQSNDTLLYDFVFVTADTKAINVEKRIASFFESYKKKDGRNGSYLLNPNIVAPIFEAQYNSPTELNRPSEKAKLKLLYARVRRESFSRTSLDQLLNVLPRIYSSSKAIKKLAQDIGISPALLAEDNAASMSSQLVDISIDKKCTESLIDRMVFEYPQIFE